MSETPTSKASSSHLPPSEDGQAQTRLSEAGQARAQDRLAKQAEALRANLLRRKQQGRARADQQPAAETPTPPDGA